MIGFIRSFGWVRNFIISVFSAPEGGLWQWLNGGYSTETNVYDKVYQDDITTDPDVSLSEPTYDGVNALSFDGDGSSTGGSNGITEIPCEDAKSKSFLDYSITFIADTVQTQTIGGIGKDPWDDNFSLLYLEDDGTYWVSMSTALTSTQLVVSAVPYAIGEEHTVRFRYDETTLTIWVDGVIGLEDSTTFSGPIVYTTANQPFTVGSGLALGIAYYALDGNITNSEIDGSTYNYSEGVGLPKDTSNKGNNAISNTAIWVKINGIESANLRAGHTPVISSDNTGGYIDLGVTFADIDYMKIEFAPNEYTTTDASLAGVQGNNASDRIRFYLNVTGSYSLLGPVGIYSSGMLADLGVNTYILDITNEVFSVNGAEVAIDLTGLTTVENIFLFGTSSVGNLAPTDANGNDIFSVYTSKNGEAIHDLIPTEGGKYLNRVNNDIYENQGSVDTLATKYSTALNEIIDGKIVPMPTKSQLGFDGIGEYVSSDTPALYSSNFTVGGWIYVDRDDTDGTNAPLWEGSWLDNDDRLIVRANGSVYWEVGGISNNISTFVLSTMSRSWEHFTVVRDGTSAYLYRNAVLVDTLLGLSTTSNLDGQFLGTNGASKLLGMLKNAFFYNESFIIEEVADAMNGNIKPSSSISDFVYDFTDYLGKTETNIIDTTSNGNNGTIIGSNDIQNMWTRYKDANGIVVDSTNNLPVAYAGEVTHNNSEVTIRQTDERVISEITANGDSLFYHRYTVNNDLTYLGFRDNPTTDSIVGITGNVEDNVVNPFNMAGKAFLYQNEYEGKPWYQNGSGAYDTFAMYWYSGLWYIEYTYSGTSHTILYTSDEDSATPPTTGWTNGATMNGVLQLGYNLDALFIYNDSLKWYYNINNTLTDEVSINGTPFPPTVWNFGLIVAYDTLWGDDESGLKNISYVDLIQHLNYIDNVIVNTDESGLVLGILTYDASKYFTLLEWNKLNRGVNDTYAPFQDEDEIWVYDANDILVLAPPYTIVPDLPPDDIFILPEVGPELLGDFTFDTDLDGLTARANSTLTWDVSEQALCTITGVGGGFIMDSTLTPLLTIGETYRISIGLTGGTYLGGFKVRLGGHESELTPSITGTYTDYYIDFVAVWSNSTIELFRNAAETGTLLIDNVSLKVVL